MRTFDEDDRDDIAKLNAEEWQIDLLKLNPDYPHWGPHEDYMWKEGDGWSSRQIFASWKDFGPWGLDDLNECVNFYFSVNRESKECEQCGGTGYHPDALWVSESFYGHSTPFRRQTTSELQSIALMASFGGGHPKRVVNDYPSAATIARYGQGFADFCKAMRDGDGEWNDKITQDEADALRDGHRIQRGEPRDAESINKAQSGRGFGHDCINRSILVEKRLERFGIPKLCPDCEGRGYIYVANEAHVSLTLWWLHPRKGCSRGIEVTRIGRDDLPAVFGLLKSAAERNAQRFARIPA